MVSMVSSWAAPFSPASSALQLFSPFARKSSSLGLARAEMFKLILEKTVQAFCFNHACTDSLNPAQRNTGLVVEIR